MNYKMIGRTLGILLMCMAALLILPLVVSLVYGERLLPFVLTIALSALCGFALSRVKPVSGAMYARDGFVIVALGWILLSAFGALPFVISGDIPHYIDAFFETVSGFTTTGASILTDVEAMGRGCMFWRMFTHWIGGMGVLVFVMAVMPMNGEHSMHIMRAEVPGPTVGKLVPRARQTAKILYLIYVAMTLIETVLLLLGGMSFYDALTHSFATAGTGGFSTRAASIGAFDSAYIEIVSATFMLLFGVNFNLYFFLLIRRPYEAIQNEELQWYLVIVAAAVVAIAGGISHIYGGLDALRHAYFNVASIISTTGFGTVDFTLWPEYCKWILVLLMFTGACAGSTGGGVKISRIIILFKAFAREVRQMARPRSIYRVQLDEKRVEEDTVHAVMVFFGLYTVLLIFFTFVISFDGFDIATNFTAALSCLSNIGPGMTNVIGPHGSFSGFSYCSKLFMSLAMLLGRLEIYPLLVLFAPRTWRK